MSHAATPRLVEQALEGDLDAQRRLVAALTPEIQWNVVKMLGRWRTGGASGRNLRQEVEDMVQEVFLELFEDDGKTLRRWDPERLPLEAFAGYVAKIKTAEHLRSRRSLWREEPRSVDELPVEANRRTPEDEALSRDQLHKVYLCLMSSFKPKDAQIFDLFFVRELSPSHVADAVNSTLDAVYKWRSRAYEQARKCRDKSRERRRERSQKRPPRHEEHRREVEHG